MSTALQGAHPKLRQLHGLRRTIAAPTEDQRIPQAGDAETNPAFRLGFLALRLQGEARAVNGIVEHAQGGRGRGAPGAPGQAGPRR